MKIGGSLLGRILRLLLTFLLLLLLLLGSTAINLTTLWLLLFLFLWLLLLFALISLGVFGITSCCSIWASLLLCFGRLKLLNLIQLSLRWSTLALVRETYE